MRKTWMRLVGASVGVAALLATSATASASSPTWKVQRTPSPSGPSPFAYFNAVSCASRSNCVGVGATATTRATAPLIESWHGSAWKIAKVKGPLTATQRGNVDLNGVSCPTTTSCVAVGTYTMGTNPIAPQHGFSEVEQNGKWVLHKAATLSGVSGATLGAVSCVSAKRCLAVGQYTSGANGGPLSEAWNGSSWTLIKSAALASSNAFFDGVSCTSSTRCTGVGSYVTNGGDQIVLAERLRGLTWHVQPTPHLAGLVAGLNSVSCPSATKCTAVGGSFRGTKEFTLAEAWNGSTWKVTPTPALAGKGNAELRGVSCTSVRVCRAVGNPPSDGAASAGLAEAWNGSSWKVQTVANPSPTTILNAVSCTSGPHCTAVGMKDPTPTSTVPLAERN
jgi:hypothetical protein